MTCFWKMPYHRKFVATIKKSFVIYNMNNNSLIETENSGRGLVFIFVYFYFVDFVFPWTLAESMKNSIEGVFFSNNYGLLAAITASLAVIHQLYCLLLGRTYFKKQL